MFNVSSDGCRASSFDEFPCSSVPSLMPGSSASSSMPGIRTISDPSLERAPSSIGAQSDVKSVHKDRHISKLYAGVIAFNEFVAKVCACASVVFAFIGAALADYGTFSDQAFLFCQVTIGLGLAFAAIATTVDKLVKIKLGIPRSIEQFISLSAIKFTNKVSAIATVAFTALGLLVASLENPYQVISFQFAAGSALIFLLSCLAQSILKGMGWNEYKMIEQTRYEKDQAAERKVQQAIARSELEIAEAKEQAACEVAKSRCAREKAKAQVQRALLESRRVREEAEAQVQRALLESRLVREEAEAQVQRALEESRRAREKAEAQVQRALEESRLAREKVKAQVQRAREESRRVREEVEMRTQREIAEAREKAEAQAQLEIARVREQANREIAAVKANAEREIKETLLKLLEGKKQD